MLGSKSRYGSFMKTRIVVLTLLTLLLSAGALAQLRRVAVIELPGEPGFDGIAYLDGNVILAHSATNSLDVFDTRTRRLVKQIEGLSDPRGLAANSDTGRVYVANAGTKTVSELSSKDWSLTRTFKLDHTPEKLLLVGNRLYISNWIDGTVSVIDLPLGRVAANIDVGGSPQSMVYDKATRQVFVTLEDVHQVIALAPDGRIANRYTLMASQPTGMALDPAARRLYVAVRYAVVLLDADTGREVGRAAAPAGVNSVHFDPASATAFAASSDGSVAEIRCPGGRCSYNELANDVRGHNVAFDSDRNLLYMPGAWRGRSKLVILRPVTNPPALRDRGTADAQAQPALVTPPSQSAPPPQPAAELLSSPR